MNLTGIISISGKPGLYKVIAQSKNSIIVESLDTNKRVPAYATDRISAIEDISIYTYEEEIPLKEIFATIFKKENGGNAPSHKEEVKKLESYLGEILPNYDRERVYPSDIRKVFQWYNKLNEKGLIVLEEAKEEVKKEVAPKAKKEAKSETAKVEKEEAKAVKATAKKATTKTAEGPKAKKETAAKKAPATKKKKEE